MKICLDAGHGQYDNRGYLGKKYKSEGIFTFYMAIEVKKELEKYEKVEIILTRRRLEEKPSFKVRSDLSKGCDCMLSIHSNAGKGTGTEIWQDVNNPLPFGKVLSATVSKVQGIRDRGEKKKYREGYKSSNWYAILRGNKAQTGGLLEIAFHDNPHDVDIMEEKFQEIAKAIATVVANHYKLKLKTGKIYRVQVGAYQKYENAAAMRNKLKSQGFDAFII